MKLLVTGYPPFDAFPQNSTHQLIESMKGDPPAELAAFRDSVVYDLVEFENADSATQQRTMLASYRRLMTAHEPDACLFCGQAAARPTLSLETIAVNIFKGERIDPEGPPAYWATLPDLSGLIVKLRGAGIPTRLSHHAGTHLCNHILYTALHDADRQGLARKAGFLHVPMTAGQVIDGDENRPLCRTFHRP